MGRLFLTTVAVILMVMVMDCNDSVNTSPKQQNLRSGEGSTSSAGTGPTHPAQSKGNGSVSRCPYAGAVVEVTYAQEANLAKIRDVLISRGWTQTNSGVHEVINGTLGGATVSALVQAGHTMLSVHVLESTSEADYPNEDRKAESLLRQVKGPVEQALGLPNLDEFRRRINQGCEG